jgi:hypothetical protein
MFTAQEGRILGLSIDNVEQINAHDGLARWDLVATMLPTVGSRYRTISSTEGQRRRDEFLVVNERENAHGAGHFRFVCEHVPLLIDDQLNWFGQPITYLGDWTIQPIFVHRSSFAMSVCDLLWSTLLLCLATGNTEPLPVHSYRDFVPAQYADDEWFHSS